MITIIVPVYKVEKYLAKCIDSIIFQEYKDFELILVDDGSPDECPSICDEYAQKDSRIRVIHKQNGGVSSARNAGIEMAKGDYIGFVDPDDYIDGKMYDEMLSAMKNTNCDMVICGYEYVEEETGVDKKRAYKSRNNEILSQKELFESYASMPPTTRHGVCNKLFKKSILRDLRFSEEIDSAEDVQFLVEYSTKVKEAIFVHKPLYYNLVRSGSATHGGLKVEQLQKSFAVHEKMYKETVRLYPSLKNSALAFLLDVLVLKYNEANKRQESKKYKKLLYEMKKTIKCYARKGLFNSKIYWKTRIYYLFMR